MPPIGRGGHRHRDRNSPSASARGITQQRSHPSNSVTIREHRNATFALPARLPGMGFPSDREGLLYDAAAGWSAASLSYWTGDINAAELCGRLL